MQLRVAPEQTPARLAIDEWAERFAQLPKRNALALARGTADTARAAADEAEQAYHAEWRRIAKANGVMPDADATRAEASALASKVKLAKAEQAVRAAMDAAAPALERHLQKHQAESMALLAEALQHARRIARQIARVSELAAKDGANVPYQLRKARRAEIALAHVLSQVGK